MRLTCVREHMPSTNEYVAHTHREMDTDENRDRDSWIDVFVFRVVQKFHLIRVSSPPLRGQKGV
jgi:hypothetical protein